MATPELVVIISGKEYNLCDEYGLYLKKNSLDIGTPEVESSLEYPPGYDFVLDFTQAVDSQVHWKQRTITAKFYTTLPKKKWNKVRSDLEKILQGQWWSFYFTNAPNLVFEGLFDVDAVPDNDGRLIVSISATCAP